MSDESVTKDEEQEEKKPLTAANVTSAHFAQPQVSVVVAPPDHVMSSIVATLFCCWPIGILAILRAMQSRDATYRGNFAEAETLSRKAGVLVRWTVGIGILVFILVSVLGIGVQIFYMYFVYNPGWVSERTSGEKSENEKLSYIIQVLKASGMTLPPDVTPGFYNP